MMEVSQLTNGRPMQQSLPGSDDASSSAKNHPRDASAQEGLGLSSGAKDAVTQYLLERVPEYRRLTELRDKGWSNPEADRYFQRQRQKADHCDGNLEMFFYNMMKQIGAEMQSSTGAFTIFDTGFWQPSILDFCMAPGGFVATALNVNPEAQATGFSLPPASGGHEILLPSEPNLTINLLDVTMLAADMGVTDIPPDHPEASKFVKSSRFAPNQLFDLVICDGHVLRTHQRLEYRERLEPSRLTTSQLALGLGRLRPGGTMIVLLHRLGAWHNVSLMYRFSKFARVRLFKPKNWHAKRGSFYMIATDIKSRGREAASAVEAWKKEWKTATFGTYEEYCNAVAAEDLDVEKVLAEFGPKLVELGRNVWKIQADALAKAPYVRRF